MRRSTKELEVLASAIKVLKFIWKFLKLSLFAKDIIVNIEIKSADTIKFNKLITSLPEACLVNKNPFYFSMPVAIENVI